jgi:hypothetical protein
MHPLSNQEALVQTRDHHDLLPGQCAEVAPGVVLQRRSFLGLCAATLLAPRPRILSPAEEARLTLEEFLQEVLPTARRLAAELSERRTRSLEDRYLHTLAAHAVRLGDVTAPELRPSSQGEGVGIGASWSGDPFVVLHWRMAPGACIRTHAHTYGNVCTLGLEGLARVLSYETVDPPVFAAEGSFQVRRTSDVMLAPHAIDLVPLTHAFCHGFEAGPDGARGLDITTRLGERQSTPYLELDPEPVDPARALYTGRWRIE